MNIVKKIDNLSPPDTSLISVSKKAGLEILVPGLYKNVDEATIISTGGTATTIDKIIKKEGINGKVLWRISKYTGQRELQGGLVKTIDWKVGLALLTETYNAEHQNDLAITGALPINFVAVNLYPFEETIAKEGCTFEEARANIDIGGVFLIRAAYKNFHRVAVIVDPADYPDLLDELHRHNGQTSLSFRFKMMKKAAKHTAHYETVISNYLDTVPEAEMMKCYEIIG